MKFLAFTPGLVLLALSSAGRAQETPNTISNPAVNVPQTNQINNSPTNSPPSPSGFGHSPAGRPNPLPNTTEIPQQLPPERPLQAEEEANAAENIQIAGRIRDILREEPSLSFEARRISVSTVGESITLSGYAQSSQEQEMIDRIARQNAGPLRVINSVRVR